MQFLSTCFLALLSFNLFSQNIIGIISNQETGEPVTGANVVLKGTYSGTFTDENGQFELSYLSKSGQVTLLISHLNYETTERTVSANTDSEITISLTPKDVLADEVIVSATRANRNTATTYTELSREEIEKQNFGQDIPFLLDQTTNLITTSDAGAGVGYTGLRIRGSDQSRINVTINGIPYNDPESQGVFWVNLPDFASSVDNIQIQRGVGTSTNGAGAFGGTINVQTTKLNIKPYGELNGTYGSFNTWRAGVKFGSGLIKDKFTFDGRLSKISSDGYIDRATSDLKSYFLSGGYYGKKTILRLNVFSGVETTYQAWWGVPEHLLKSNPTYNYYNYDNEIDRYQQDHYQAIFSQTAGKKWLINSALHYTRGRGYFEQYKGPEYNNDDGFNSKQSFSDYGLENLVIGNDTISETSLIRRRWLDNHFYGLTFSSIYDYRKLNITMGGAWNQYDGDHYGEIIWAEFASNSEKEHRYYDNTGLKNDFNIFAKASYTIFGKLNLFADIQFRRVDYKIDGIDNDQRILSVDEHLNFFNPKFGLSYTANNHHELYASFSIGNREPTRNDYIDVPAGMIPEPEMLRNLETGYRFKKPKNILNLNYYLMHYKDQLVLTGELNDVGSPVRTNVDKSYRTGIEASNQLALFSKLFWDVNFAYSINRIKHFDEVIYVYDGNYSLVEELVNHYENTDISFSPSIVASSALTYKPVEKLGLSFISKYVGEQYLDNTSSDDRKIDDYFISSFRFHYTLTDVFFREIMLALSVNNIFNAKYEANGYTFSEVYADDMSNRSRADYNYYYPQAGTHILAGITLKF